MYGYKDVYFNRNREGFRNSVWIELLGFDNTSPDFGVEKFLSATGFVPHMVSFLLTSVNFVLSHKGMEEEVLLPRFACSYGGHEGNDERTLQPWTNRQFAGLVEELHRREIQVYIAFLDVDAGDEHTPPHGETHPEVLVVDRKGRRSNLIHMLKRYADGTPFEEVFIEKLKQTVSDYSLDGVQIADGISSPRLSLQAADFSVEFTDEFLRDTGISLPEGCDTIPQRAEFIFDRCREAWIDYNTRRWREFMTRLIQGLASVGAKAAFNSAWTRGPLEALYRYGADYKAFQEAGADSFIVEDVAADLFILSHQDNVYEMNHERRKFIHYEFLANLMQIKAYLPHLPLTPLCMIRDTHEQWDVLHHMPTAMQRAVAVNLNNFWIDETGVFRPLTNGPHFNLGDGLKPHEWDFIRLMWDNAYTEQVYDVKGVTVVWSDKKLKREWKEFTRRRLWYNGKWVAELLRRGAAVHKIVRMEDLAQVKGPLLVINPALFDEEESEMLRKYKGGNILSLGLNEQGRISFSEFAEESLPVEEIPADVNDPCNAIWTHSLTFPSVDSAFVDRVAEHINRLSDLPVIEGDYGACHVNEVLTSPHTSRLFVDNEEYYYATVTVRTSRKIQSIKFVTKPDCYPIRKKDDYTFHLRIPGFGMDIVEITYAD